MKRYYIFFILLFSFLFFNTAYALINSKYCCDPPFECTSYTIDPRQCFRTIPGADTANYQTYLGRVQTIVSYAETANNYVRTDFCLLTADYLHFVACDTIGPATDFVVSFPWDMGGKEVNAPDAPNGSPDNPNDIDFLWVGVNVMNAETRTSAYQQGRRVSIDEFYTTTTSSVQAGQDIVICYKTSEATGAYIYTDIPGNGGVREWGIYANTQACDYIPTTSTPGVARFTLSANGPGGSGQQTIRTDQPNLDGKTDIYVTIGGPGPTPPPSPPSSPPSSPPPLSPLQPPGVVGPCINGLATANDPTVDGYWLDLCYSWGSGCGKPAADAWCQSKGFSDGSSGSPAWTYKSPTKTIGSGDICTGGGCGAITSLQCIC
ncbi:MAG: hypothetical protein V1709_09270, partial [Planctomycetota bacterium]